MSLSRGRPKYRIMDDEDASDDWSYVCNQQKEWAVLQNPD